MKTLALLALLSLLATGGKAFAEKKNQWITCKKPLDPKIKCIEINLDNIPVAVYKENKTVEFFSEWADLRSIVCWIDSLAPGRLCAEDFVD